MKFLFNDQCFLESSQLSYGVLEFFSVFHYMSWVVYMLETDHTKMLELHITVFKCKTDLGLSLVLQMCFRERVSYVPASLFLKYSMLLF